MPNSAPPSRGGFWRGAGSHVFTHENFISEILTPIAASIALSVAAGIAVGLLVLDSLILGPMLWAVIVGIAIVGVGGWRIVVAYYNNVAWGWIIAMLIGTGLALAAWIWQGIDWLIDIWPASKFALWWFHWPTWWKIIIQVIFCGCWLALALVGVRLSVEIFDPGWSRRFERDAALTGVRATFPLGYERFPAHELNERIRDLEYDLENAKIEMRRVRLDITNGNSIESAPDLPDSDLARQFYREVADNPKNFSTQRAMDLGMRAMFENEIRDVFLKREWAYWVNPLRHQDGLKLRAAGFEAICGLALPHPD